MKYKAFISYSHAADSNLAPSLEEALEKFAKTTFQRRALRIFRDSSDLSASPNLWSRIEESLAESEYFILLASPQAAQSRWCAKEIEYWKRNKSHNHLLIVVTDGELAWDETKCDFDRARTTCLPENAFGLFEDEPLYVDFRDAPDELSLVNPAFRDKVVLLAATLHGLSIDDMVGEGIRQHKKTIRLRNSAISLLVALLTISLVIARYAFQQRDEAIRQGQIAVEQQFEAKRQETIAIEQRDEAIRQANTALARSYLSDSKANLRVDPTLAVRLAQLAYEHAKLWKLDLMEFEDHFISTYYFPANNYLNSRDGPTTMPVSFGSHKEDDTLPPVYSATLPKEKLDDNFSGYFSEIERYGISPKRKYHLVYGEHYGANMFGSRQKLVVFNQELQDIAVTESYHTGVAYVTPNLVRFDEQENRFVITGQKSLGGAGIYELRLEDGLGSHSYAELTVDAATVIDISRDGNMVAVGRRDGVIDIYKLDESSLKILDSWQLRGHRYEPVEIVAFMDEGARLYSKSKSLVRNWRTTNNASGKHFSFNAPEPPGSGDGIDVKPGPGYVTYEGEAGELNELSFWGADKKLITTFKDLRSIGSPHGTRFRITRDGLLNHRDELLIANIESRGFARHSYQYETAFSENGKYAFIVDKIFTLDVELLLSTIDERDIATLDTASGETYRLPGIGSGPPPR